MLKILALFTVIFTASCMFSMAEVQELSGREKQELYDQCGRKMSRLYSKNPKKAINLCSKHSNQKNLSFIFYIYLGLAHLYDQNYEEAENNFRIAHSIGNLTVPKKDLVNIYKTIGNKYMWEWKIDKAVTYLERGLEIDMNDPRLLLAVGEAYYHQAKISRNYDLVKLAIGSLGEINVDSKHHQAYSKELKEKALSMLERIKADFPLYFTKHKL